MMLYKKERKCYFGEYGGCFAPETLMAPLAELEKNYLKLKSDPVFLATLQEYLHTYVGRPTPLYFAHRLTQKLGGAQIYLKREEEKSILLKNKTKTNNKCVISL